MVETVVALVILSIIGTALVLLMVQIQALANAAKFKSLAESYAEAMLEQVRAAKASDWGSLQPGCYLYGFNPYLSQACTSGSLSDPQLQLSDPRFSGYVNLTAAGTGFQAQAFVYWSEKGTDNKVLELDTYVYPY
ncbi:MAG: hypothetical protein UY21_C0009G0084 [Microgenomates group bacterium GW2011_GWA1_48_10]|nr:MAG: hypothetical protein UY21_C0009G0084 [Microgenomates group bacterium GW2011_GWA1_48_10]